MKNCLFVIAIFLISFTLKSQCLSGVYTIGGITPDYATITAAVNSLTTNGVCGPVTFNIRNGVYNEQVSIPAISGSSPVNTITITSENNDSSLVKIKYNSTTSAGNYVVQLNGVNYLKLSNLTIEQDGNNYNTALKITNFSYYATIDHCRLLALYATTSNSTGSVFYSPNATWESYILIKNCIITGGYCGIYLSGTSSISGQHNTIDSCIFYDHANAALNIYYQKYLRISNNFYQDSSAHTNGFLLSQVKDSSMIVGNVISGKMISGINYAFGSAPASLPIIIYNNMISVSGLSPTGTSNALFLDNANNMQVLFNSLYNYTPSGDSNNVALSYYNNFSNYILTLRNNHFVCTANGCPAYIAPSSPITLYSNYNNFYTPSGHLLYYNSTYYNSLAAWQATGNYDSLSLNVNPLFVSTSDLHAAAPQGVNAGLFYPAITTDRDGQSRSNPPDIGADEYYAYITDVGVATVYPQQVLCLDTVAVSSTVKNYGVDTLHSFRVHWKVNQQLEPALQWNGILAPGDTVNISLGSYPFNTYASYSLSSWTSNPNMFADTIPANDSAFANIVLANTIAVDLGHDTSFCVGDSVLLTAVSGSYTYLWSTGQTTQSIYVTQTNSYWVRVTNANGCHDEDTVAATARNGQLTNFTPPQSSFNHEMHVSMLDLNGDGYVDLLRSGIFGTDILFNDQSGHFSAPVLLWNHGYDTYGIDFDNDGDNDVITGGSSSNGSRLYLNNGSGIFTQAPNSVFNNQEVSSSSISATASDIDRNGRIDISFHNPTTAMMYYYNTTDTIVKRYQNTYLQTTSDAYWFDYDNDNDDDLMCVDYFPFVWRNDGDSIYTQQYVSNTFLPVMGAIDGASVADYDHDGWFDLFFPHAYTAVGDSDYLYHNNGNGTFTRVTNAGTIVQNLYRTTGSAWCDYNNDGWIDLLTTTSNPSAYQSGFPSPHHLFLNNGNGTFTEANPVTIDMIPTDSNWVFKSVVTGDFNNDGSIDAYFSRQSTYDGQLFSNNGNCNSWIEMRLEGNPSNRSGLGTRVFVYATIASQPVQQMQELQMHTGHLSNNDLVLHFGLGNASVIDSIVLYWPSGNIQVLNNVATDQILTIPEDCSRNCNYTVWPGNTNNDSIVNSVDLLTVGLYYGDTGTARIPRGNNWAPYQAANWGVLQNNGQDKKHADCDGNGKINADDTLAIDQNFGLVEYYPMTPYSSENSTRSGFPLFMVPTASSYAPGAWVDIDVQLGDPLNPVIGAYGVAYTIQLPAGIYEPGTISLYTTTNWLTPNPINSLDITHIYDATGFVHYGLVRTDHVGSYGYGTIAHLHFKADSTISQLTPFNIAFVMDTLIDSLGNGLPIGIQNLSLNIDPVAGIYAPAPITQSDLSVIAMPNPFTGSTQIVYHLPDNDFARIDVIDLQGKILYTYTSQMQAAGTYSFQLNSSDFTAVGGMYLLRLSTSKEVKCVRLMTE